MLQQNFFPGKAIQIWGGTGTGGSDDANIPNPSYRVIELTGTTSAGVNNTLVDATATFVDDISANKFAIGDIVYQPKNFTYSTITAVTGQTTLTVANPTFFPNPFAVAVSYQIYRKSPIGAILYIASINKPNAESYTVEDLNGTPFSLFAGGGLATGEPFVLPFQCTKLLTTGTTLSKDSYILALFQ